MKKASDKLILEFLKYEKGQVWVETIVYTLIALSLIGLFITFAKPKMEEIQDKSIIEQSTDILEEINGVIISMTQGGPGNQRIIEMGIKKGIFEIDGINNQLSFEIEGKYTYTEPGDGGVQGPYIQVGNLLASTQKRGKVSTVTLLSNYSSIYDIKYKGGEVAKSITRAPIPYKLIISNEGEAGGIPVINFNLQ